MRNHTLILMVLIAGCSRIGIESDAVAVKLVAPIDVTGTWSLVDTSRVLSCSYDVNATARGGVADEEINWTDAIITLVAPPASPGTQPYSASNVAQWFHGPTIKTGSSRTAHLTVGREGPFTAEHELGYRTNSGDTSIATVSVHCRAPS